METDKSEKKSVSFPIKLLIEAEEKAADKHGGVLSKYIQYLVEKDTSGGPVELGGALDKIIVQLSERLQPGLGKAMADECERLQVNQPRLLGQVLFELYLTLDKLARDEESNASDLVTGKGKVLVALLERDVSRFEWKKGPELSGKDIVHAVKALQDKTGKNTFTMDEIVEEAQAEYGAGPMAPLKGGEHIKAGAGTKTNRPADPAKRKAAG